MNKKQQSHLSHALHATQPTKNNISEYATELAGYALFNPGNMNPTTADQSENFLRANFSNGLLCQSAQEPTWFHNNC